MLWLTNQNQSVMLFSRPGVSAHAAHSSQLSRQWLWGKSEPCSPLCPRQPHTDPRCPQGGAKSTFFPLQLSSADGTPCEYQEILLINKMCQILWKKMIKWPPLVSSDRNCRAQVLSCSLRRRNAHSLLKDTRCPPSCRCPRLRRKRWRRFAERSRTRLVSDFSLV